METIAIQKSLLGEFHIEIAETFHSLAKIYKSSYVPKHLISRLEQTYKSALDFCLNHYKPQEVFLIHGDCHVGNILWQQDKPFLIDFDDSVIGPPVQDIWLVTGGDPEESFKKKDWLLSSYENFSAFDPQSLALLPSLKVMRQICFSGWIAERYDEEAFKRIFPLFSQDKYWFEEIQNIELHLNP